MGRPRDPGIVSQLMHCKKHKLVEHRKYLGNHQTIMWQCVFCNRERAAAQRGVDIHFENCMEHGYTEHRTYQHGDGCRRTLCTLCHRRNCREAKVRQAEREKREMGPAQRPVCPSCFLEPSVTGSCGCDG